MKKNPFRLRMDFEGPWLNAAAALMGGAFFLRAVYYFGVQGLCDDLGTLLLLMAFPMILEAAFVIILRGARLNLPFICVILSVLYCVLLQIQCFLSGNFFRAILGSVAYPVCTLAMIALVLGWLKSRGLVFTVFFLTLAIRFVLFDLGYILEFNLAQFMPEAAALLGLLAMALLPFGMKTVRKASRRPARSA